MLRVLGSFDGAEVLMLAASVLVISTTFLFCLLSAQNEAGHLSGGRILIAAAAIYSLSAVVGASLTTVANAGSTGGMIGVTEKSVSGGNGADAGEAKAHERKAHHSRSAKEERSQETGRRRSHTGGDTGICAHVRSAVRAATSAGLDNGVGLIAAARAQCGG
jgi:hypothetical protein